MTTSYFITGTDTGIGKTVITCALTNQLRKKGKKVASIKPIISGWSDHNSDTHQILKSLDLPVTPENIDKISPWRLKAPLSPDIAAKKENREIAFDDVVKFCQQYGNGPDYLFIEGAGGVMTPVTGNKTIADLIFALQIPVLLVTGTYLGSISHTLTALKTLESYNIKTDCVIVNQSQNCVGADDIIQSLQNFTRVPTIFVPSIRNSEIWKEVADFPF
jgi:dethiobiotin synthetase